VAGGRTSVSPGSPPPPGSQPHPLDWKGAEGSSMLARGLCRPQLTGQLPDALTSAEVERDNPHLHLGEIAQAGVDGA
jgi:hypothetical protein